ncbi:MAG: ATP-binding protein [Polyangiaceae bacterium]
MHREQEDHIRADLQSKIVLLAGPRQAGKTTLSKQLGLDFGYLNFDSAADRRVIAAQEWDRQKELVIFDELHKMRKWKSWLKGVYDTEGIDPAILVTGSARLEVFRRGSDSLAGRHFLHRLHPFTVREVAREVVPTDALDRILRVGGFPEPFLANDLDAARRWRRGHLDSILREDLLDLERVRDVRSVEILVDLLRERVGSTISMSSLTGDLETSVHTVKRWLQILENLYVIFAVRPWHRNIARSLLKEAKYYFYDTGAVADAGADAGAVFENAVACALQRELHLVEDTTGHRTALHFIRDKEKREVDFLAVVGKKPRQLVEAKLADDTFSKALGHFRRFVPGVEAIQVVRTLARAKSDPERQMRMVPAVEYLGKLSLRPS